MLVVLGNPFHVPRSECACVSYRMVCSCDTRRRTYCERLGSFINTRSSCRNSTPTKCEYTSESSCKPSTGACLCVCVCLSVSMLKLKLKLNKALDQNLSLRYGIWDHLPPDTSEYAPPQPHPVSWYTRGIQG